MSPIDLLRWQWEGYSLYHRSRANLALHIVVVPLFLLGNVTAIWALVQGVWWTAVGGMVAMVGSIVAQGRGHGMEINPPIPFTGPVNTISRIFLEQWITFPRFVLSGAWSRAWRAA